MSRPGAPFIFPDIKFCRLAARRLVAILVSHGCVNRRKQRARTLVNADRAVWSIAAGVGGVRGAQTFNGILTHRSLLAYALRLRQICCRIGTHSHAPIGEPAHAPCADEHTDPVFATTRRDTLVRCALPTPAAYAMLRHPIHAWWQEKCKR
jgi:hypothetical protein